MKYIILGFFLFGLTNCSTLIEKRSSDETTAQTSVVTIPIVAKLVGTAFIPDAVYTTAQEKTMIQNAASKLNEVVKSQCFYNFIAMRKMIQTKNQTSKQVADHISNLSGLIAVSMHFKRWTSAIAFREPNALKINLNRKYFTASKNACIWASTMAHEALGHALGGYDHDFKYSPSRDYSVPYSINAAFDACCR
jgi:hypothetical protein